MSRIDTARPEKSKAEKRPAGPHWRLLAFLALILLFLDQASKHLAVKHLADVPPKLG